MWPCFNIFSTYPHPKTRTIKKHTHGKNPSLPVNGVENPESFCWGRDGWISPPCLVGFPQLRNPKRAGQSSNLTCAFMVRIGLVKKPPALGCFFMVGCVFFGSSFFLCVDFVVHLWEVSYLDNVDLKHLILIEDTQAEQWLETVGIFFGAKVLNIIF